MSVLRGVCGQEVIVPQMDASESESEARSLELALERKAGGVKSKHIEHAK